MGERGSFIKCIVLTSGRQNHDLIFVNSISILPYSFIRYLIIHEILLDE